MVSDALPEKETILARTFPSLRANPIANALFRARITHVRYTPKPYALSHNLTYLNLPLTRLKDLPRLFLARNRFSLFSLYDRDYGDKSHDLDGWIKAAFASAGAPPPDGPITLVTLPRVAGFGFNPVSFWMCHARDGSLSAVLAEVNNTFGERHCYLCRKPDGSAITPSDHVEAQKVFHVSPFMDLDGRYLFRFIENNGKLAIKIDLYRGETHMLSATMTGRLEALTSASLLQSFFRHPFPTLQVILLIHYHAARLYLLGLKLFAKPAPPAKLVSPEPQSGAAAPLRPRSS